MEMKKSQLSSSLLEKIKIVKGEKFVTIEDTNNLTNQEFMKFIPSLMEQPFIKNVAYVNILVHSNFSSEVEDQLKSFGFNLHDKNVIVHKKLEQPNETVHGYELKSLESLPTEEFKDIWEESMKDSPNASSSLTMDEQMHSVEVELGETYQKSCIVAYEKGKAIGVTMPHIEPGTVEEGRIFYFGLLPKERGKGKSKLLHQQTLSILKSDFRAAYYIGSTSYKNIPMLKTFESSGCTILEENKVYKRKN